MLWGEKNIIIEGSMTIVDETNKLKVVAFFKSKKDPDRYEGIFYKSNGQAQKKPPTKISEIKDIDVEIAKIYGNWKKWLIIGEEEIWNVDRNKADKIVPIPNAMPSDSRFREDLIWLRRGNEDYAQCWKSRLEIQ